MSVRMVDSHGRTFVDENDTYCGEVKVTIAGDNAEIDRLIADFLYSISRDFTHHIDKMEKQAQKASE